MNADGWTDNATTVIVLDFETTGMSPDQGDRSIEVGAIKIINGQITDRFQALMNPRRHINGFIEALTGISNEMVNDAPDCEQVMQEFADFIDGFSLVAHNASFDRRFLDAELARIGRDYSGEFACSMLAARRIYPDAPNHRLATLVEYCGLASDGTFHRALADAEMTAGLWLGMLNELHERYQLEMISFAVMQGLTRVSRGKIEQYFLTGHNDRRCHA